MSKITKEQARAAALKELRDSVEIRGAGPKIACTLMLAIIVLPVQFVSIACYLRLSAQELNTHNLKLIISLDGIAVDRLQTMTVFVRVAEEAGFAPAARRLGMSPSSVTRAVTKLEARLSALILPH